MAKEKLKKFNSYCENLLPNEISYLHARFKSTDPERTHIMNAILQGVQNGDNSFDFDLNIDKRKYSKSLNWMQNELDKIDVDKKLKWINECLNSILLDEVSLEVDQSIARAINSFQANDYYFMYFYEMLLQYRQHLLIRMQYQIYQKVNDYIERNQFDYKSSRLIFEQLHQATHDIIGTGGSASRNEAIQWKNWLLENFKNARLDGLVRHMSAIRYIFVCLRYNTLDDLEYLLFELEKFFEDGRNYTRRLLVNFYDNMLVLYDQKKDFEQACYFGYLSIKYDRPDAIIYRNNLINVLIKMDRFEEALHVIETANFKLKHTRNMHSAIGFISNHIRCLTKVNKNSEAIIKGQVFMQAYLPQILKYRWHRFFTAYHSALLKGNKFNEIIRNTEKLKLASKEKARESNKKYSLALNQFYFQALLNTDKINQSKYELEIAQIGNDALVELG